MADTALNFHCRMMAALIHDCLRFFDPPAPLDTSIDDADCMISCTIHHRDLFRLPTNSESEPFFTDTSHYISLPFDQLQPGNNLDVWNGAVEEEWKLHITNLVILRDILSVHPFSDRIIFQDLKPLFISIIEDVRQELHVFLHANEGDTPHSAHIRNLRDALGRLFPYDSSRFQRVQLHTYRFPDTFSELRRLADVPADNDEVLRRDPADETHCQCQTQRCLLLDLAHALLEWVRDGADSYGRVGRHVRGPTSAAFTDPFTRKLLAARDLSCGLVNGGDMFTLTYRTVIEQHVDGGGELSCKMRRVSARMSSRDSQGGAGRSWVEAIVFGALIF
ncbi:hypothetical protein CPB85DRAFT_1249076 [Mucidula mucida]|nr:hypothetical protein CPB85DRAFT_1249076 [Mucidula mucida]